MSGGPARAVQRGTDALSNIAATLKSLIARPGLSVDHKDIIAHLEEDGSLSVRYAVLTALSCAIAILGLLLSSPAVIIGAMLISPLMGPIILFGFSLATLDQRLVLRGLAAIAFGSVLTIAEAAIIVWLSPLQSVTPEILARTHPNFFDLLVAIFSGVAGAYAVSQRKGETIVGVAIATALMPPLAVAGFGVATGNWSIFGGAGGLYMTNLLAIGLTASLVAKVFGFDKRKSANATFWQTVSIVAVFAILSIPLGLSLKRIASEAVQTSKIRATLQDYFDRSSGHIYGVEVSFPEGRPVQIDALVIVRKADGSLEARLQQLLGARLRSPVQLTLSQVPVQPKVSPDRQAIEELTRRLDAMPAKIPAAAPAPDMAEIAALRTGIAVLDISADLQAKKIVMRSGVLTQAKLADLRAATASLRKTYPDWTFALRLEPAALPPLLFSSGSSALDADSAALLGDIVWALQASGVHKALATGFSDTRGKSAAANRAMALQRARTIARQLQGAGISASAEASYPVAQQTRQERQLGQARFRRVEITPD